MRILIVDDMGAMRQTIKRSLRSLGFADTLEAKNGKDAFDTLLANHDIQGKQVKLCIVDWNMTPVPGIELLKMVRADARVRNVIFIMLTAEQSRDNIVLAVQARVDDYIIKPFTNAILKEKLNNVARKKLSELKKTVDDRLADMEKELQPMEIWKIAQAYEEIFEFSPWSYLAPMGLARLYLRVNQLTDAETWARKAVIMDFGCAECHTVLSTILRRAGKIPESIKELEIAVVERPSSGDLKQKLGEAYLKNGDYDKAIAILSEAMSIYVSTHNPKQAANGKNALGKAKVAKGEAVGDKTLQEHGVNEIQSAVSLDPNLISAQYNLMAALKKIGRTEEAMAVFDALKEREPEDAEGWIALGKAFLEKDEAPKALFAFGKADELAGDRFAVYEEISDELYTRRMFREAIPYLEKAKRIYPSDAFTYNLLGIIHRHFGAHQAALQEYLAAVQLDPEDAGLYYNIGMAYTKSGQAEKAGEYFEKAQKLDPSIRRSDDYIARRHKG